MLNSEIKIDVVIPVRNGMPYLKQTLESVLKQKILPNRIVVVNNSSTDGTKVFLKAFSRDNPMIEVINAPKSLETMALSWNFAVSQIGGDWYLLLAADDLLHPNFIRKALKVIPECNAGAIAFRSEVINQNGKLIRAKLRIGKPNLLVEKAMILDNLVNSAVFMSSTLIRREKWEKAGKFPAEYIFYQDMIFWQELSAFGGVLKRPEVLGRYRIYQPEFRTNIRAEGIKADREYYIKHRLPELAMRCQLDSRDIKATAEELLTAENDSRQWPHKILFRVLTALCTFLDIWHLRGWPRATRQYS